MLLCLEKWMSAHETLQSHILVTSDIDSAYESLKTKLLPNRVVGFVREKFLLEDAKAVVSEAYISEPSVKYIILAAFEFHTVSQNALLKILEEPPTNINFIIITPSKSNLLATVRSRLPIIKGEALHLHEELEIDLKRIDYAQVFEFLKEHARIKRVEAKELLEALYHRATVTQGIMLSHRQLENFEKAYRLLELNGRPQSILAMILMGFIEER